MDYSDKSITLKGVDYIVLAQVDYENRTFVYLVNDKNTFDTLFGEISNNEVLMIEPKLFKEKLLPLFLEKLKK